MTSQSPHLNRWPAFALLAVAFFMTAAAETSVRDPQSALAATS